MARDEPEAKDHEGQRDKDDRGIVDVSMGDWSLRWKRDEHSHDGYQNRGQEITNMAHPAEIKGVIGQHVLTPSCGDEALRGRVCDVEI